MHTYLCTAHYVHTYIQHHSEVMETVKPFELVYKLMTTKFKLIEAISYGSPFILMTEVSCTSPWQLLVVEAKFKPVCRVFYSIIYIIIILQSEDIQTVGENVSQVEGCKYRLL